MPNGHASKNTRQLLKARGLLASVARARSSTRHLLPRRKRVCWRLLPHEFPSWKTVYQCLRARRLDGTRERMHQALRERVRVLANKKRNPQPSAGVVDSRSIKKTTGVVGGERRGYTGAREGQGPQERHLLVDAHGA